MPNLTLSIGGRPLKIQCSDQSVERVKQIGQTISKLIDDGRKPDWVIVQWSGVQRKEMLLDFNEVHEDDKNRASHLSKEIDGAGGGQQFFAVAGGQKPSGVSKVLKMAEQILIRTDK